MSGLPIEIRQITQDGETWLEYRCRSLVNERVRWVMGETFATWGDWSEWTPVPQVTIEIDHD